jgi:hypothetical protein
VGGMGGCVQIACLGVELNECSTQLVATSPVEDGVLGWGRVWYDGWKG